MTVTREWLRIKDIPEYAGVSERTAREWIKRGLRCSRLPSNMLLIRRTWLDEFLEKYADQGDKVERAVDEILSGLERKMAPEALARTGRKQNR